MRTTARSGIALAIAGMALAAGTAQAQTDVGLSLYGAFNQSTSGNNTRQSPANQAGGLLEVRRIRNPLVGYEVTYAYNRDNQGYTNINRVCPGSSCTLSWDAISANAHEVTADWIVSLKVPVVRPFVLAGGGVLVNVPSGGTTTIQTCSTVNNTCQQTSVDAATSTSTKGVFVYGGGVDWTVVPHIGLRFQYRGNLYKAPDLANAFRSTDAFTHTAQPMIGVFFRL